ncbi:MAG TPA: aromatic ring-hydroxylating dioxygenase subunit alpha [Drouetiella sp.]|jgi:nitrite reductase/ring-hydroxylating ferredoxin subunit
MQVPNAWYTVAASSEVQNRPISVKLLGEDFVLWRDSSGKVIMQKDTCPHRSAKLSLGAVQGNCIQCPFHGFTFDTTGSCTFVPETEKPAPNLRVETHGTVEQNGFVWFNNNANHADSPPWFAELNSGLLMHESVHEWPTHVTRCVENQLDYAHLPFVHRTTIGRNVDVRGTRKIECQENRISMYVSELDASKPAIQFIFPNLWLLTISHDKFYQFISFVPVSDSLTRLYLRAYQRIVPIPFLAPLLTPLFNKSNSIILNQDRNVVLSQRPSVSTEATDEKHFPSDRAVEHFRRLWLEQINTSNPRREQTSFLTTN